MVQTDSIVRTANVIHLAGTKFQNAFNKKLRFESIDFSGFSQIEDLIAPFYPSYKNHNDSASGLDEYRVGWNTYNQEIDIATRYAEGAKYLYLLSDAFVQGTDYRMPFLMPACGIKKNGNTYVQIAKAPTSIASVIAKDSGVANGNSFNCHLEEQVYTIKNWIDDGATAIVIGRVAKPGPYKISTATNEYNYNNTCIDHPIAYWIYEE